MQLVRTRWSAGPVLLIAASISLRRGVRGLFFPRYRAWQRQRHVFVPGPLSQGRRRDIASFDDGPLLSPERLLVLGKSIRAGRGAKLALYTLLLFTEPSVLMLYALLAFEFGERRPQLTARTGYTPMQGSLSPPHILSCLGRAALVLLVPGGTHIAHRHHRLAPGRGLLAAHARVLLAFGHP